MNVSVSVKERGRESVCVLEREGERESVCKRASVCVIEGFSFNLKLSSEMVYFQKTFQTWLECSRENRKKVCYIHFSSNRFMHARDCAQN